MWTQLYLLCDYQRCPHRGVNKTHEGGGGGLIFCNKPDLFFNIRSLKSCCLKEAFIRNNQSLISVVSGRRIAGRLSVSHYKVSLCGTIDRMDRWVQWKRGGLNWSHLYSAFSTFRESQWLEWCLLVSWTWWDQSRWAQKGSGFLRARKAEMMKMLQGNNHQTGGCWFLFCGANKLFSLCSFVAFSKFAPDCFFPLRRHRSNIMFSLTGVCFNHVMMFSSFWPLTRDDSGFLNVPLHQFWAVKIDKHT